MDAIAFLDPNTQKVHGWMDIEDDLTIIFSGKPVYFDPQYISLFSEDIHKFALNWNYTVSVRPKFLQS